MDCENAGKTARHWGWTILKSLLCIGLAAGIIAFLIQGRYQLVLANLRDFDYRWLIPAVFCYLLHLAVGSWRWCLLAQVQRFQLTQLDALFLTMKAFFFSLVLPGGAIGGDLVKVGFLSTHAAKGTKVEGAFTILVDRIVGMVALFVLAIVVIIVAYPLLMQVDAPELYSMLHLENRPDVIHHAKVIGVLLLLAMCFSGLLACVIMFMHRQLERIPPIGRLMQWADRHSHGAVSRCTAAVDIYRDRLGFLFWMTVVSVVFIHLNLGLIVFFLTKGLHIEPMNLLALLAAITLGNIAGLIPLTPSGIGFRDYILMKVLVVGGATLDKAQAAAILFTSLVIACNMLGGIFFALDYRKNKLTAQGKEE